MATDHLSAGDLPSDRRVLLITLPWGSFFEPNLGLGILKAVLGRHQIGCDVLYGTMHMMRYLKPSTYALIGDRWGYNDFVFSGEFQQEVTPEQKTTLRALLRTDEPYAGEAGTVRASRLEDRFTRARQEIVPRFFDDLLREVDFSRYALVGLTCLFDQTIPSLALARRIRREHPDLMLAFGGYALQRPVGPALQRVFPEMDVVAYGDGEPTIVPLYEAAIGRRALSEVPNIAYRNSRGEVVDSPLKVMIDLNDSPTPDYDDFVTQRNGIAERYGIRITVGKFPVESSRGCWYGAKSHCTFCGIDDETLRYRSKSAVVVERQLQELHDRYGAGSFRFADYIMPRHFLKDLLPTLRDKGAPWHLHWETKSNLKDEEIKLCADAGVVAMQPGIESLSSDVLKLMRKGVRAMQNTLTIFTMIRYRILPAYNFLFGFPNETPESYRSFLRLVPALHHLHPPETVVPVMITRYAPLQEFPGRFGSSRPLRGHRRYDTVFTAEFGQRTGLKSEDWCYVFENPYDAPQDELKTLHAALMLQVLRWQERYKQGNPKLTFRPIASGLRITDARLADEASPECFSVEYRYLAELMPGAIWTERRIMDRSKEDGFNLSKVRIALEVLCDKRVVVNEEDEYVWIAFHEDWNYLTPAQHREADFRVPESDLKGPEDWQPREETHCADASLQILAPVLTS
jgi:ribosomal peptide maturation radical SAM protein 1